MTRSAFLVLLLALTCCGDETPPAPTSPDAALRALDPAALERLVGAFNRGVALMDRFEAKQAIPYFETVAEIAPTWATARFNLGVALLNAERRELYPRAEEELKEAIRLVPDDPRPPYALGMLLQHLTRYPEARALFARVLELDPDDADSHFQLGSLLMDEDPAAARRHLRTAYDLKPHHENACYRLFQLLREAGEMEEAQELIARFRALKQTGAGEPSAIKYGEMGRYADVIRAFGFDAPEALAPQAPSYTDAAASWGIQLEAASAGQPGPGVASADVDGDGDLDLFIASAAPEKPGHLLVWDGKKLVKRPDAGIDGTDVIGACFGDYDRDGDVDLYLTRRGPNLLYANDGTGRFTDVTASSGAAGAADAVSIAGVFADADHDGDLDLYVANRARLAGGAEEPGAPNQLLQNDGKGAFVDVAKGGGVDLPGSESVSVSFFDVDGDRDLDLYVVNANAENKLFLNGRVGLFREADERYAPLTAARAGLGVALADVDGNGLPDVLLLDSESPPRLLRQEDYATYRDDAAFAKRVAGLAGVGGALLGDLDLDGHVDLVLLDARGDDVRHRVLMNLGAGRFAPPVNLSDPRSGAARGAVPVDLDGDGALELIVARDAGGVELWHAPAPKDRHWLTVVPGRHAEAKSGPTPGTIGLTVEVQTGRHLQLGTTSSMSGYLGGTPARLHFGLGSAPKADYVRLTWPDAVLQSELEVGGDQRWTVAKVERKPSSCPLLFSWDGSRFAYVTDFLGVGGCGFFLEPGVYAPPDPTEAVRIPPAKIAPHEGRYKLRVAEPLEEVTYLDELHLRVYDHPARLELFPDERFAATEPLPTTVPWVIDKRVFPRQARDHRNRDVTKRLLEVDRRYVEPPVDKRFVGFATPHFVELDFRGRVPERKPGQRLILFLHGWVEYTYSHVNYAAWQAGLALAAPRMEVPDGEGGWKTVIADVGFPAGLPRMMTVDVTDVPLAADGRLRLHTNMEIFWDQAFLGVDRGRRDVKEHRLFASRAELRFLGYPREFSPDGGVPTEYDYARIEPGLPYKLMAGAYTRFGDVRPLLAKTDDQFVIIGRGEEIVLEFDATKLPPVKPGWARTVVLYADGYCKDMDLYTAYPDTVEPLPFHGMVTYPPQRPPPADDAWQREWNTRMVRTR